MTRRQSIYKQQLIKLCHIHKAYRFPDEELRRDYLQSRYGVNSFKDLDISELREVAIFLGAYKNHKNNSSTPKKSLRSSASISAASNPAQRPPQALITVAQLQTIEGLWEQKSRNKDGLSLRNFICRTTRHRPLRLELLSRQRATMVITGLKKMKNLQGTQP